MWKPSHKRAREVAWSPSSWHPYLACVPFSWLVVMSAQMELTYTGAHGRTSHRLHKEGPSPETMSE